MNNIIRYTRCKRCQRILTSTEARLRGYGDVCWKLHLEELNRKNSLFPIDGRK